MVSEEPVAVGGTKSTCDIWAIVPREDLAGLNRVVNSLPPAHLFDGGFAQIPVM